MDHNLHANASLQHHHHHWGYGHAPAAVPTVPQNHWIPPPQSHLSHHSDQSLKRAMSESDCEELYSEESSKEQISPSNTGSCQLMSRKKRRGVIEKKRRDRINSSLTELKRLVPSAYEKQGSAKLEKAEILQLTVEHLKNLQGKGMDSLAYDPQRFAMEYHTIGFRECAAEVARYLVTIEGMDIQDPLRLRLMSHLQYFAQTREFSAKSCANPNANWSTAGTSATGSSYQPSCAVAAPYQTYPTSGVATHSSHANVASSTYMPNLATIHPYPVLSASPSATSVATQQQQQQQTTQQQQQQQQQPSSTIHMSRSSSASAGSASNEAVINQSQSQTSLSQTPSTSQQHEQHQAATQQQQQHQSATQQQQQQQHQAATQQQQQPHQHQSATQQQHQAAAQQQQQQHQSAAQQHQHQAAAQQQHQLHYTQDHQNGTTYIELTNSQTHSSLRGIALPTVPPTVAANSLAYSTASAQYAPVSGSATQDFNPNYTPTSGGSKPYRPWGAEMAY